MSDPARIEGFPPRPLRIGVIGSGDCDEEVAAVARRVGQRIAARGAILVCGGLGGVMRAVAEGARESGGTTLGILPGTDGGAASPGVVIPVPTGLGEARNALVVMASEAVIAIAGGWGTLAEAAFCLKLGIPLIRLRSDLPSLPVPEASSVEEAVEWAVKQARDRRQG